MTKSGMNFVWFGCWNINRRDCVEHIYIIERNQIEKLYFKIITCIFQLQLWLFVVLGTICDNNDVIVVLIHGRKRRIGLEEHGNAGIL